jgi:hypothetical protein
LQIGDARRAAGAALQPYDPFHRHDMLVPQVASESSMSTSFSASW